MSNKFRQVKTFIMLCLLAITLPFSTLFANTVFDDCSHNDCLAGIASGHAGFLLVAPDRGYAGNQTVRASFAALKKKRTAQLVFMTDERAEPYIENALNKLRDTGATQFIVLPLFFSASHPKLTAFRLLLKKLTENKNITFARVFGQSYLAVEMLSERLTSVKGETQNPLLLITQGATSTASVVAMRDDIKRIADAAIAGSGHKKMKLVVLPNDRKSTVYKALQKEAWDDIYAFNKAGVTHVLPFHLGVVFDSMMSVNAWAKSKLPDGMKMIAFDDNEVEFFSLWMQREANRYLSSQDAPLGIVFHAHGADFHWNQGMRDAVNRLAKKYPMEFAFSMADPKDLRQAVQRLEKRGVGVVIIVRVFGMRSSFRHGIERLIGLDIEAPTSNKTETATHQHHRGSPVGRLKTTALVVTEGGLEDSDLFAQAMLEKAKALSENRAKETVIVVAHGKGTEHANQQWMKVLDSLVTKMKANGGDEFNAIHYQTWQEDWDDKRGERINAVLKLVNEANKKGGSTIIIPARTTGKGRASSFLKDVNYKAGTGFAPHPLFSKWVEQQIIRGVETVKKTRHIEYPLLPQ